MSYNESRIRLLNADECRYRVATAEKGKFQKLHAYLVFPIYSVSTENNAYIIFALLSKNYNLDANYFSFLIFCSWFDYIGTHFMLWTVFHGGLLSQHGNPGSAKTNGEKHGKRTIRDKNVKTSILYPPVPVALIFGRTKIEYHDYLSW